MHYVVCTYVQIFNHNISLQKQHGKPTNADSRHVGDLGNIVTPLSRFTLVSLFDGLISLDIEAENGIADRAFVVHAGEDDLGMNYFGRGCWGWCPRRCCWAGLRGGVAGRC
jgi:Cu/Zn superoxide dismutase